MPKFLEKKLKKEYGAKSDIPYKIMNKMGVMSGSKITAKGKAMEAKHNSHIAKERKKNRAAREAELAFRKKKKK